MERTGRTPDGDPAGHPSARLAVAPAHAAERRSPLAEFRAWELWKQPVAVIGYVLLSELGVLAALGATLVFEPRPVAHDFWCLGGLACAAIVHHVLARRAEERRRDATSGPHFDLTSVWTYAGVVVLPTPMALLLIVLVRVLTFPHARRPTYRYLFGSAEMLAAAIVSGALLDALGRPVPMLLVAAIVYGVVQAALVGGAIRLTEPGTRWRDVLGSPADNETEAVTLVAGVGLALVLRSQLGGAPAAAAIVGAAVELGVFSVVVAIVNNRLDVSYQRLQRLREHNQRLLATIAEQHQRHDVLAARAAEADLDHKTGLLNDRGWNRHALQTMRNCRSGGDGVAVLMVDLDHFKQINDTWGHATGDHVLKAVADILRNRIRGTDIVGRCGGEEFVALLPATNYPTAVARAEEVRIAITEMSVTSYGKRRTPTVIDNRSVSIGVAVFTAADVLADKPVPDLLDRVISLADDAMYVAKATGRNRVCRADGKPIDAPEPTEDAVERRTA